MEKYAVIVAGGAGLRMGATMPKQFMQLRGRPVLWHTLNAFLEAYADMKIILVLPEQHMEKGLEIIRNTFDAARVWVTAGGETRFQSVKNGLQHIDKHSIVFVHDGVRCLLTPELIRRCYEAAVKEGNAIPSVTAIDTIRMITVNGSELIDRNKIRIIQTPQTFYSDIIKAAFEQDYSDSFTDEANVVEKLGVKINLIEGEQGNIKITHPMDMMIAEKILEERELGARSRS
jgi:2-C-methyl-D-erythritol 4-phosphate cytidylyltransferase